MDDLNRDIPAETNPQGEASVQGEGQAPALEVAPSELAEDVALKDESPAWEGEAPAEPLLTSPLPPGEGSVCEANAGEGAPEVESLQAAESPFVEPSPQPFHLPQAGSHGVPGEGEEDAALPWDVSTAAAEEDDEPLPAQAPILALDPTFVAAQVPARSLPAALVTAPQHERSPAWTIPVMCLGLAMIAACLIVPATETNRRLAYEQKRLKMDLEQIEKQIAVNDEFLHKVKDDPTLAQRLALRQMKMIRAGTTTLDLKGGPAMADLNPSPFSILAVPPPPQLEPYKPRAGLLSTYCLNPKWQMYLIGAGLMMVAGGLIMGASTVPAIRNIVGKTTPVA